MPFFEPRIDLSSCVEVSFKNLSMAFLGTPASRSARSNCSLMIKIFLSGMPKKSLKAVIISNSIVNANSNFAPIAREYYHFWDSAVGRTEKESIASCGEGEAAARVGKNCGIAFCGDDFPAIKVGIRDFYFGPHSRF